MGGKVINLADTLSSLQHIGGHPTKACKFPEKPMAAEDPGSLSSSDSIVLGATEGCRVVQEEWGHQLVIGMCFYVQAPGFWFLRVWGLGVGVCVFVCFVNCVKRLQKKSR